MEVKRVQAKTGRCPLCGRKVQTVAQDGRNAASQRRLSRFYEAERAVSPTKPLIDSPGRIWRTSTDMSHFSTNQAAKKLGISLTSLRRYIAAVKVPAPKATMIGGNEMRAWTEQDIERVRALLPSLENGRKTRHQKQRKKQTTRKPKP